MGRFENQKVRVHFEDQGQDLKYLDVELRTILAEVTGGSGSAGAEYIGKVFQIDELKVGGFIWPLSKGTYLGHMVKYPIAEVEDRLMTVQDITKLKQVLDKCTRQDLIEVKAILDKCAI